MMFPGGTTCMLQPVDSNVGKQVKTQVKKCFIKWYTECFKEITTPEGRRKKSFKKPTNEQMAEWIMTGVSKLRKTDIMTAFANTGITCKAIQKLVLDEKVPRYLFYCWGII